MGPKSTAHFLCKNESQSSCETNKRLYQSELNKSIRYLAKLQPFSKLKKIPFCFTVQLPWLSKKKNCSWEHIQRISYEKQHQFRRYSLDLSDSNRWSFRFASIYIEMSVQPLWTERTITTISKYFTAQYVSGLYYCMIDLTKLQTMRLKVNKFNSTETSGDNQ